MRLTVNGVPVRVVDRIEVVLDVAKEGDTLLNGVSIKILGGPLTIEAGDCPGAVYLWQDSVLTLNGPPMEIASGLAPRSEPPG